MTYGCEFEMELESGIQLGWIWKITELSQTWIESGSELHHSKDCGWKYNWNRNMDRAGMVL